MRTSSADSLQFHFPATPDARQCTPRLGKGYRPRLAKEPDRRLLVFEREHDSAVEPVDEGRALDLEIGRGGQHPHATLATMLEDVFEVLVKIKIRTVVACTPATTFGMRVGAGAATRAATRAHSIAYRRFSQRPIATESSSQRVSVHGYA